MTSDDRNSPYEDKIFVEPKVANVVFDETISVILNDRNLRPLLNLFIRGNFTVKELVVEYEKITSKKRSDKTIYHYLKKLSERGLVTEVGKRYTKGVKATESIYGRTSRFNIYYRINKGFWIEDKYLDESTKILQNFTKLLSSHLDIPEPDIECVRKLMMQHDEFLSKEMTSFMETYIAEVSDITPDTPVPDLEKITIMLRFYILVTKAPKFFKDFEECFGKK